MESVVVCSVGGSRQQEGTSALFPGASVEDKLLIALFQSANPTPSSKWCSHYNPIKDLLLQCLKPWRWDATGISEGNPFFFF